MFSSLPRKIEKKNKASVSMMVRESSAVPWRRFIMKFDSDLNFVAKVEGPKWIEEETILRERLCAASNGNIYFAVAGETFSALYELSPDAKWTELEHKRGQTFIDVLVVVGPVTGLLLVEERRGCVCLYGIRESMTPVERPGAMCIDEQQQLFLHDLRQAKVRHIQTSGNSFEPDADVALAEKSLYALSANNGFLAATYRSINLVLQGKRTIRNKTSTS
ncbi:unnamed protein product [Toxocara canis]|uniref:CNH domain-containing protein n=1 Tax=Toxocara canis TaxID=6265 RepID=A0A183U2Y7_TOXCA|nr:unnamed protein product [Toxocara canis]